MLPRARICHTPADPRPNEGTASWYGPGFVGKATACQDIFDPEYLTAAHKSLPLPCYAKITNLKNGKACIVCVNDRGPYHGGRILDCSRRAAECLGFVGPDLATVRIKIVSWAECLRDGEVKDTLGLVPSPTEPIIGYDAGRGVSSCGPLVVEVQKALSCAPDGSFGADTRAAVRTAQSAAGRPASGWVDLGTWRKLIRSGQPHPPVTPASVPPGSPMPVELRCSALGPRCRQEVLDLQVWLGLQGYKPGPPDGVLGRQTVKGIQRCLLANRFVLVRPGAKGDGVDGRVGPLTRNAITQAIARGIFPANLHAVLQRIAGA